MIKKSFLVFILLFSVYCIFAQEETQDSQISDQEKQQLFNDQKVELYQREYYNHGKDKGVVEAVYGDNVLYDLYRGDGSSVKLSTMAYEMGNRPLGDNLRLGEGYYGFAGGLAACSATTGVLLILGIAFTVFRNGIDFQMYEYCDQEPINEYMASAIAMFSVSAVTLIGVVILSIYTYKSYQYKFNVIQAQSLIKQYNKFLQKKIGLPLNLDVSYRTEKVGLTFKIAL